ncbi:class I SAM-dependent methyltransferase [Thalassotalea atypica]|uniref:class I SAM-dependent methyltransferase n=1 Tax=Thalassotalea atypica TaxID=2054316 RepID=UPI002574584E|nr:methyltransferase domain-containing protein [Thalassotalea atypica]
MTNYKVLVQASSRSWAGGVDICMGEVEGEIAVMRTLKRVLSNFDSCDVVLVAPEFDRGGELDTIVSQLNDSRLSLYYGHDASPLNRMVDATSDMSTNEYIIRVDGIHFCFDPDASKKMLAMAQETMADCVKLPDDFPVHFTSEVFNVGALRTLESKLVDDVDAKFKVHPKCYFVMHPEQYKCEFLTELPTYSDEYLAQCRKQAHFIYEIPRQEVNSKRIASGDRLGFHYELALQHLNPSMKSLDIACADGYGVRIMAKHLREAHGADLDPESVDFAKKNCPQSNTSYFVEDITKMSFEDNTYDAVTSFETLEHVPDHACLAEVKRILKPGGIFVLSTPQNSIGHIPVNSCHLIEYSLKGLLDLVNQYFFVVKVVGIKAGIIYDENDPYGTNTVLICTKPRN